MIIIAPHRVESASDARIRSSLSHARAAVKVEDGRVGRSP